MDDGRGHPAVCGSLSCVPLDDALPGDPVHSPSGEPVEGVRSVRRGRHTAPGGDRGGARDGAAGAVREARRAALAALGEDPRRRPPRVDGYEVRHLLGAGGSAVVWAGAGPDGVLRALKVLQPVTGTPGASDATGPADPLHELSLLRRVRHPRVVAVHDISRDEAGNPVLVLDLAPGGSLAQVLRQRRRLGAAEVVGLLSVLGPALEELHSAGVVHGDLAPGNVLLDARGEPLLADLGLARAMGRRHGSVLGTPGFADPAVVAGEDAGAAADVYGLAAVAWWALTGQVPPVRGAGATRRAARRAGAQLPAGTSAELLAVLREGLQRKPSRRPTPGELAQAAAGCAQPRPVRVAASRGWSATEPSRRHGAGSAGGAARVTGATAPVAPVTRPVPGAVPPLPAAGAGTAAGWPTATGRPPRPGVPGGPLRRRALAGAAGALTVAAALTVVVALRPGAPAAGAAGSPVPVPAVPASGGASAGGPAAVAPGAEPAPAPTGGTGGAGTGGAGAWPGARTEAEAEVEEGQEVGDRVLRGDDPGAVVRELAARRADALRALDPAALAAVDAPGSPALQADTALLEQVRDGGTRWSGLGFDVAGVVVEAAGPAQMVVVADVVTQAHEVVAEDGSATSVPATAPRRSRLTLVRVEGSWRVEAVG